MWGFIPTALHRVVGLGICKCLVFVPDHVVALSVHWWARNEERRREASHGVCSSPLQGSRGWRHPFVWVNWATGYVGGSIVGSSVTVQGDLLVMRLDCGDVWVAVSHWRRRVKRRGSLRDDTSTTEARKKWIDLTE